MANGIELSRVALLNNVTLVARVNEARTVGFSLELPAADFGIRDSQKPMIQQPIDIETAKALLAMISSAPK